MKTNNHSTRRQFIKQSIMGLTGAAMAPAIVPQACFGANEKIGVAMIGMGRQAIHANLNPFLKSPSTQVLAVCEVDTWRLKNAQTRVNQFYRKQGKSDTYQGCDAYGDFRHVLERQDIDAVMISTPDHWHVPMAILAAKAGKDISCEKPLTLSIAEGRLLSDTVKKYGRVFRTDSEFRSHKAFHRAVELVRNGVIGELHTIFSGVPSSDVGCPPQPKMPVPPELNYPLWLGPGEKAPYTLKRVHPRHGYGRPGWMRCPAYCEGMVSNWGTHLNDIAQWGHNSEHTGPVEVEGFGRHPKQDGLWKVMNYFELEYKYADGVKLHYVTDKPYIRFEGSEGWVQVEFSGLKLTASSDAILNAELGADAVRFPLKSEKQDFIDAVKTRGKTLADAEVGHRTTSLCQIGHIACQVGKKLYWDPNKEIFTNSDQANGLLTRELHGEWSWESL